MKRVVVSGVGVVSAMGTSAAVFWEKLCAGVSGIGPITAFDPAGFACRIAGQVPDYKISEFVPKNYRKATKLMARDIELAIIAAHNAIESAGIKTRAHGDHALERPERFGCNIGAGLISAELNELTAAMDVAREGNILDLKLWGSEGMSKLTPLWLLKYLPNMLACHVTIIHGLMGPSNAITCDAASGHLAIGEAFRTIQRGKADLAICGGAESRVNLMGMVRQQLAGRLTTQSNDDPQHAVKPFDPAATGSVYGEGGALLILEEYEHATARGATIYAELAGFAGSQNAYAINKVEPTGHAYGKSLENALRDAKLTATDLDLLVPYGIGHALQDAAELRGIRSALGEHASRVAISAIKPQVGLTGAGCSMDAAAAVLALHHGQIPPSLNTPGDVDGVLNVSDRVRSATLNVAASSTSSLGGHNATLVFRKVS